jgi:hypothetical protein
MLNIKDIFDEILIRSGQFILASNNMELNIERFRRIVESTLAVYSRYSPHEEHILVAAFGSREIDLTGGQITELTGKPYLQKAPKFISDCMPVRQIPLGITKIFPGFEPGNNPELYDKQQAPFEYRNPKLYLPFSARWDILACFDHAVYEKQCEDGKYEYFLPTITLADQAFFDYLQGMFLLGLGRSRRAFTLNDLPITMDASDIASEGQQMRDQALEFMSNHQKWYLAW